MKAISPSYHEKLLNIIQRLADEGAVTEDIQFEISLLISCHNQYREQLSDLRRLILQYQSVERRLRVALRKKILLQSER